jgi:hypothetical protein
MAKTIIARAALIVAQNFIGFVDLFEARFRVGVGADIGMVFARQASKC